MLRPLEKSVNEQFWLVFQIKKPNHKVIEQRVAQP